MDVAARGPTGRGIVTPEAVVLDLPTASVPSRAAALAIDLVVQLALLSMLGLLAFRLGGIAAWLPETILGIGVLVVLFAYPAIWESAWRGRTPGKAALGLRVVTLDGAPVQPRHAVLRAMLGLVDFWLPPGGAVAVLTVLASPLHQRLGDMVAGTVVLHERLAVDTAVVPLWYRVPPGLEGWVDTLDPSALPPSHLVLVRSFLLRAGRLSRAARADLGRRLATATAGRLGHLPPPGVDPETYLTCVLAAGQRRAVAG